jgi:hypothetical protein
MFNDGFLLSQIVPGMFASAFLRCSGVLGAPKDNLNPSHDT